ncbi:MAG: GrpB family protein [Anaerolineales bacterium]|jgi:GrpB-like predicted nucleotidyltransferase (UPF0157 family)
MLGQHKKDLAIVQYNPAWADLFELEAESLLDALGDNVLSIEHIGSTSIPGLAAKPIIDIMIAADSLEKATELIPTMEEIGYEYRPHDPIPGRRFFVKESSPEVRTHHANLTTLDSLFWRNQILFRNYLRTHDQLASEYADLKIRIAEHNAQSHQIDPNAKTEFVSRVLELAEGEE